MASAAVGNLPASSDAEPASSKTSSCMLGLWPITSTDPTSSGSRRRRASSSRALASYSSPSTCTSARRARLDPLERLSRPAGELTQKPRLADPPLTGQPNRTRIPPLDRDERTIQHRQLLPTPHGSGDFAQALDGPGQAPAVVVQEWPQLPQEEKRRMFQLVYSAIVVQAPEKRRDHSIPVEQRTRFLPVSEADDLPRPGRKSDGQPFPDYDDFEFWPDAPAYEREQLVSAFKHWLSQVYGDSWVPRQP